MKCPVSGCSNTRELKVCYGHQVVRSVSVCLSHAKEIFDQINPLLKAGKAFYSLETINDQSKRPD